MPARLGRGALPSRRLSRGCVVPRADHRTVAFPPTPWMSGRPVPRYPPRPTSGQACDLIALSRLNGGHGPSYQVAQGGATRARLVSASQDDRRLLRSVAHAQCAPPFGVLGLAAPKARALPTTPLPGDSCVNIAQYSTALPCRAVRVAADGRPSFLALILQRSYRTCCLYRTCPPAASPQYWPCPLP
jgi:hypothetical protein